MIIYNCECVHSDAVSLSVFRVKIMETPSNLKCSCFLSSRCGRLTYHISLPYSILGTPYVENAIKDTYCKRVCGDCRYEVGHTHAHKRTQAHTHSHIAKTDTLLPLSPRALSFQQSVTGQWRPIIRMQRLQIPDTSTSITITMVSGKGMATTAIWGIERGTVTMVTEGRDMGRVM